MQTKIALKYRWVPRAWQYSSKRSRRRGSRTSEKVWAEKTVSAKIRREKPGAGLIDLSMGKKIRSKMSQMSPIKIGRGRPLSKISLRTLASGSCRQEKITYKMGAIVLKRATIYVKRRILRMPELFIM